jgi:hypothetical protein
MVDGGGDEGEPIEVPAAAVLLGCFVAGLLLLAARVQRTAAAAARDQG